MTPKKQPRSPAFMPAILARLAPQLGAKVIYEPEFQIAGRIIFPNGRSSYFWHNKFNLNSVSSSRIAQDKAYAGHFLREAGFRVPATRSFYSPRFCAHTGHADDLDAACRHAAARGYPVFLKPNKGSQGVGVDLVHSETELRAAAGQIFRTEPVLLVQERIVGRESRLVVLDGEVISAYRRFPLTITGDGVQTIDQLLAAKQAAFIASGRDTVLRPADPRIDAELARAGLRRETILPAGQPLTLLHVANLCCGGDVQDFTEAIPAPMAATAIAATRALDLRFAGVDLIEVDDLALRSSYVILEINSAPGLDNYASDADALYLKVLRAIERGPIP
jgi:D-alanine-D-alanine ligase-like ATP-grasp enzyme